jgi:hypothetical protein
VNQGSGVGTLTRLLPLACLLAALCLFASELMTMFEFIPPGGEAQDTMTNAERHGNAMFVISAFAIAALAMAVFAGSKPAAITVAAMGLAALLFFLVGDLPKAGQVGSLDNFFDAEAVPQEGFWLMLVSSLALSICGIALATLSPEQLAELRPGARASSEERAEAPATAAPNPDEAARGAGPNTHDPSVADATGSRLPRRPRTRQRG